MAPGGERPGPVALACRRHQVHQPEGEGESEPGLELVDTPEGPQRPVQPVPNRVVEGGAEGTGVSGQGDQDDSQHGEQQPAALGQIAPGQAREPQRGGERRAEDGDRRGRHGPAGGQPGFAEVEVGDPVAGAAQQFGRRHRAGGGVGLFDVRHEVVAVDAEQQQWDHPPGGGEHHTGNPPGDQGALARTCRAAEQIEPHGQQRGECRCRVDSAHEGDEQRGRGRGHPWGAGPGERQQYPREQRAGERGRRCGADDDGVGGPQCVADGAQQPGPCAADDQALGEPQCAPERGGHDQREPQPLGQPHRDVREVGECVVREGREGVSRVLVGEPAESGAALPQLPEVADEPPWVGDHSELGLERHPAR